jgi:hypothetical protein
MKTLPPPRREMTSQIDHVFGESYDKGEMKMVIRLCVFFVSLKKCAQKAALTAAVPAVNTDGAFS